MANLLKAQGRLNATSDKLREIGSEAATESLCCNILRASQSLLLHGSEGAIFVIMIVLQL